MSASADRAIPEDVAAFGRMVSEQLEALLGNDYVGAYFVGSIALGGYVPGESDLDVIAVTGHVVPEEVKDRIADALLELTKECPARGMEFTLYRSEMASSPPNGADFEVNVNGGPRMARSVHVDSDAEPGFWYVLDRAIAARAGVTIVGPPAASTFAAGSRASLLAAMEESMRWHREHEKATLYSVLNASRAWRYAVEDVLGSKLEGAAWARSRWRTPALIDAAVELRHGRAADLAADEVEEFLLHVEQVLATSAA